MPRPILPLILVALALPAVAVPPGTAMVPAGPRQDVIPEDSRWLSFVRLVEARWRVRTTVLDSNRATVARQYEQCIEDAWQLAIPGLISGPKAPCGLLAEAAITKKRRKAARKAARNAPGADWARRFEGALVSPSRAEFLECTQAGQERGDAALLAVCAGALHSRVNVLASLDDPHRFGSWMDGCKRAMLGPAPTAGEKAPVVVATRPQAEIDAHARHCLRVFPTLYEIQWMKKLGDFWTPEEQRALYVKSRQLGVSVDAD